MRGYSAIRRYFTLRAEKNARSIYVQQTGHGIELSRTACVTPLVRGRHYSSYCCSNSIVILSSKVYSVNFLWLCSVSQQRTKTTKIKTKTQIVCPLLFLNFLFLLLFLLWKKKKKTFSFNKFFFRPKRHVVDSVIPTSAPKLRFTEKKRWYPALSCSFGFILYIRLTEKPLFSCVFVHITYQKWLLR